MPESADRVGQQIGAYRLVRLLGEGGFAEVYLGEHVHLGTQAAIKVLHTRLAKGDIDKFRQEARTIASLDHPNIVRVFDFNVENSIPYLVMDYAPNGTLRRRHKKGTILSLQAIVAYVRQTAEALQYAHEKKLIHRDIKPENMLLGKHNEILLSDFGIAVMAQSSRYQNAQDMAGTMTYMAPEQIQGKPRTASDQYSLAIVVYEWLTGRRPFHGSLTELIGQHISAPPPSIRAVVPSLSPDVEAVIMKALAKEPKERYARITDFALALDQACQKAQPPASRPPQPPAATFMPPAQGQPTPTHSISPVEASMMPAVPPVQAGNMPPLQFTKEEAFSTALAHLEAERYQEALTILDTMLRLNQLEPHGNAYNLRGLALFHLKRYPEALTSLNNAIYLNGNDATAHFGVGLALERMQRYPEALQAFDWAIQLRNTNVSAWRKKGDVLSQLKRYEDSLAAYEQALRLDPNDGDTHIGKGTVLKHLGRAR